MFFGDAACFDILKRKILPALARDATRTEPIRIWIIGCSTGAEAYSTAIAVSEFASDKGIDLKGQIFATDESDHSIEVARAGLYSKEMVSNASPERLRRFFTETPNGYHISKHIREMCVFARQNVRSDPPFSRMDLVNCRNSLIRADPGLDDRLIHSLHFALNLAAFCGWGSLRRSPVTVSSLKPFIPGRRPSCASLTHRARTPEPFHPRQNRETSRVSGSTSKKPWLGRCGLTPIAWSSQGIRRPECWLMRIFRSSNCAEIPLAI
jgi:hypothetical protein